jgi:predicted nucleotidyltransferase
MTPVLQRALDNVRHIVLNHLADRQARVYLFGSCARGDVNRLSDIDVAIEPLEPLPGSVLSDIREDLEESTVPYFVDVVDLSTVNSEFRARVLRDGVIWKS